MISRGLIERIFSAFSIERWNDHPRPLSLTEMDKQAHKAVIAVSIACSMDGMTGKLPEVVEGLVYGFLQRAVLTDMKPPVFYWLMETSKPAVDDFVLKTLEKDTGALKGDFHRAFGEFLVSGPADAEVERLLGATHYLATLWEFDLIAPLCQKLYGFEETQARIKSQLLKYRDIPLVEEKIASAAMAEKEKGLAAFVDLAGQLRFQKRWTGTPRVPETSVLGHALFVALMAYFLSSETGSGRDRSTWNFIAGLFHDLPEVLTRDIISPIKRNVEGLEDLLKGYEETMMEERIVPLLPERMRGLARELTAREFEDREFEMEGVPGKVRIDGTLVNYCDKYAAFIEAALSMRHGIRSSHLEAGYSSFLKDYGNFRFGDENLAYLADYFR